VVQVSGAGAEAVTHCATFTPAESLVAEQASRAFGMMEACEWADLDALAQQVGPTVVARGVCVSWAGRVCQLGGACVSVGRGVCVSWAGRVCQLGGACVSVGRGVCVSWAGHARAIARGRLCMGCPCLCAVCWQLRTHGGSAPSLAEDRWTVGLQSLSAQTRRAVHLCTGDRLRSLQVTTLAWPGREWMRPCLSRTRSCHLSSRQRFMPLD
jgi:hypothetical protein